MRVRKSFQAVSFAVVTALLLSLVVAVAGPAAPAEATVPRSGPTTGLDVTSTGNTVLAGSSGRISVTASNSDSVDQFNATTVVVLPVGVTYVGGSTQGPQGVGDPTIMYWIPDPNSPDPQNPAQAQVLVWENTADLPQGSRTSLSFAITADNAQYPVGSTFPVGAAVYANSDERTVPEVTVPASGAPDVDYATTGGVKDPTVTVAALSITKAETRNAEAEVYRGPENPAEFTITVKTADAAGTNAVVVTDLVPATFTVTGCGAAYTCEIVTEAGKVYTKLTWNLGNLGGTQTRELKYTAYVAEREVTMPGATTPGASTRPTGSGYAVTNTATATGTYQGGVIGGGSTSISISAKATVTVLDVGIVKTTSTSEFREGKTMQYTLSVRSSQYITSSGLTITDTIPDGMCPVLPAGLAQGGDAWPDECATRPTGAVTGGTMTAATYNASNGRFTVTFAIADLAESAPAAVTYSVYMRKALHDGTPTSAGGSFTNSVDIAGTTTPTPTSIDSGSASVTNDSSATLGTGGVTLTKEVWANAGRSVITDPDSCKGQTYTDTAAAAAPAFQLGDLVCFRIQADFPAGVATRGVVLADFFPTGMQLAAQSLVATSWVAGDANDVAITGPVGGITTPQWRLGTAPAGTTTLYVQPSGHLEMYVVGRITTVDKVKTKVAGNLAKMRYTNADDVVLALRDGADVQLAPPPPVTLDKKVNGVDGPLTVREEQTLNYTIAVTHGGSNATLTDYPLRDVEVWDVLPAGFDCRTLSNVTPAATGCAPQADGTTRVTWQIDRSADPLEPGETITISYTLTVPTPLSVSSTHENQAAVTRFRPVTTNGMTGAVDSAVFYPTNSVGAYQGLPNSGNAPEASDKVTVVLGDASVSKVLQSTNVTESGNSATQATIGETAVWQYTATVPARTSIFNAVLTDGLPVGSRLTVDGATAPTATSSAGVGIQAGCAQDASTFRLCTVTTDAQFGTLFFPARWTNNTDQAATFTVTMPTRIADVAANTHGAVISNTAELTSTATQPDTTQISRGTSTAEVTVVVPNPTLAKASSATGNGGVGTGTWSVDPTTMNVAGGSVVYYRLTATNTSTAQPSPVPPLHDAVIVDCIDNRLGSFTNGTASTVATVVGPIAGNGLNGCAIGRDKYTWTLTAGLSGTAQIYYSAVVPSPIPAGSTFLNSATLTGSTLDGVVAGERPFTQTASRTVTAAPPTVAKAQTPTATSVVPGGTVSWRVTMTIPIGVNLNQARIIDNLAVPLGLPANATFTVSCGAGWSTACPTGTYLTPTAAAPQVFGVYLGDIPAASTSRVLYLDVSTTVLKTTAASVLTARNQARISWNVTPAAPPTTAVLGTTSTAYVNADVAIRHPAVATAKSVKLEPSGTSVASVAAGQGDIFSYTVSATATNNSSPNGKDAYNVTVVDTLPAGVIPVASTTNVTPLAVGATVDGGGVWNGTTITWTVPHIAVGTPFVATYPATLAPASTLSGSALQNQAIPTRWESRPTAGEGQTYTSTTAARATVAPAFPKVDAAKRQVTPSNPVYIGDEVTFEVTLTNNGDALAATASAVDTLPAGWTYVAGSSSSSEPTQTGQVLTWAGLGPLPARQSATFTYRAKPGASVNIGSQYDHTNTVTAANVTDATGGDSYNGGRGSYIGTSGSATAKINAADLKVDKEAGTFTAGGTGRFTITVTNGGPDAAVGVRLNDALTLPTGVRYASADAGAGTCALTGSTLDCSLSALAANATWVVTVTVAIDADVANNTTVPNTATVSAKTADPDLSNNSGSATGTILTKADLEVVKKVALPASGPVTAGTAIQWTVTLTNKGPSVSRGTADLPIVLVDTLPADVSQLALSGTIPDGCTLTGRELRCALAHDMAVGDSITVTVGGVVDSDVPAGTAVIKNSATVTPVTDDPVTGNNTSAVSTDVEVREQLSISKTITQPAPPAPVTPGSPIQYTLKVANAGPSDARGVYVIDTLPADIVYRNGPPAGSGWTVTVLPGNEVRFSYTGIVAAGTSAPDIVYTALLNPSFTGDPATLVNTAWVSSAWEADQDDSSAQPGLVKAEADLAIAKTVRPTAGVAGDSVVAGETAIYTLTVRNLGPSDAQSVRVVDTLPANMTVEGTLPAACTALGQIITCTRTTLGAGATPWSFDIPVRVSASFTGSTLTNEAIVSAATDDPVTTNNLARAELPVIQRTSLTLTKTPDPATVVAGTDTTWAVTVTNTGTSDAQSVVVRDTLDPRLVFVSATSEASGFSCTGTSELVCSVPVIPAGGNLVMKIVTAVNSSVPNDTTIPNAATATSTTIDPATDKPATATGNGRIEVIARSTLTIDKTPDTQTVTAGKNAAFTIAVGNQDGPSDAAAPVTLTDQLPAGLTYVDGSAVTEGGPAQWSCTANAALTLLTCVLTGADGDPVSLAAGTDAPTLHYAALVDAGQPAGTVTNSARVTSSSNVDENGDPVTPTDTADIVVQTFADLGLTKTHAATDLAVAGLPFTWTLTVANGGPSDSVATADNPITVVDTLPADVTLATSPASGGLDTTCAAAGTTDDGRQIVTCTRTSTIDAGDDVAITLNVDLGEDVTGKIVNDAEVFVGATAEPSGATLPNKASDTVTVREIADLEITKTVSTAPEAIVAGESIAWQLTVTNRGPSNSDADEAHPITVIDTMPEGVLADTVDGPDAWTCAVASDRKSVTCVLPADLETETAQVIDITGTIDPSTLGPIENVATVTPGLTPQPPDATENDTARAESTVNQSADLALSKSVSAEIVAGATGRYLLQVTNNGPSTARGVTIVDTLPDVLTFESVYTADGADSPWTCTPGNSDPRVVTCDYDGVIVPTGDGGTPVSLEIVVSAAADLTGAFTNVADVTADTPDPNPVNNHAEVEGPIVTTADLVVTKTHADGALAVAGQEFTWTVTATNDGPSDSVATADRPIVVTDRLAEGTTFVADGSAPECVADATDPQVVVCTIAQTIAARGAVSLEIRVALDEALEGTLSNSATATPGDTADPNLGNNTGTDQVTITESADLSVVKEVATPLDQIVAGRQVQWTIAVTNGGPSNSDADADNPITVTDTLPAGVSFVSGTGEGWTCEAGDAASDGRETVECTRADDLAVGAAPVISLTGLIAPDAQGEIRNDVVVAPGLTTDPNDTNNASEVTVAVEESADLAITKAVTKTIEAGGTGEYTLTVTNLGPSSSRGISVVDTLPAGLTFKTAAGEGWTCAPGDGSAVDCTYDGILAPAETLTFTLTVDADASLQGDIVNTAVVSSTTFDPVEENNTATATGTVAEQVDLSVVKTAVGDPIVGETFSYEIAVSNAGPATARGVRVEDAVPAGLEVVSVTAEGWTCGTDASTGKVACLLPELAAGADAPVITIEVRVLPAAYPEVANTATVTSTTPECPTCGGDNTSTVTVPVPPKSDLAITKTLTDELVTGSQAHYTITVVNGGPTLDPGPITVSDPMPEGLVARGATLTGADGSCSVTGAEVTCTLTSLEVGQAATVTVTVDVLSTARGEITNTATAASAASDKTVDASASGTVTVVDLPSTGGQLGLVLPIGLGVLGFGLLALWWARRRRTVSED